MENDDYENRRRAIALAAGQEIRRRMIDALTASSFAPFEEIIVGDRMGESIGMPAFEFQDVFRNAKYNLTVETVFHVAAGIYPGTIRLQGTPLRVKLSINGRAKDGMEIVDYTPTQNGDNVRINISQNEILSAINRAKMKIDPEEGPEVPI